MAAVLAMVLLLSSAWMWFNEATVASWLAQQLVVVDDESEEDALLGLQANEHWLVVVVDFEQHPAGNGWGTDDASLLINQAAVPYIEQLSGMASQLTVHVHPTVVRATGTLAWYGADGANRDTDDGGEFLPLALAHEVVSAIRSEVNWSVYDLDDDGTVDRFLILHTTKGQEESPSVKNRIWSHFTHFEEPVEVTAGREVAHYTMASLQTGSSGVGTILHEMMHQLGAVDLYPVHDEHAFQSWKGPGDWDIMASGSWNGGGRWPAMPTGASMELIVDGRVSLLDLVWPATAEQPCMGPTVAMKGVTENGSVLKIDIAEHESVFIELRSDAGYDARLPGHGILVTYQDRSVGNLQQNELNTNPNLPWLSVVEADGRQDLVSGANAGEASDVFGHNSSFGAHGVQIRTHDGILVPWTATVDVTNETTSITFEASECVPNFSMDLPDHGATILSSHPVPVQLSGETEDCTSNLVSSDGRTVQLVANDTEQHLAFSTTGTPNSLVTLSGTVTCGTSTLNLAYTVQIMNRIPVVSLYEATISPYAEQTLTVPILSIGNGSQRLNVYIDGPLSRIATSSPTVDLNTQQMTLEILPNNLLTENMLVHGEIVMMTDEGLSWTMEVTLTATTTSNEWYSVFTEPARMIALLTGFLGIYALFGARPTKEHEQHQLVQIEQTIEQPIDAWGRTMDEASTASFDVEV